MVLYHQAALVGLTLVLSACYPTTIRADKPAAPPTIEDDSKWHHGFIYGIAELS